MTTAPSQKNSSRRRVWPWAVILGLLALALSAPVVFKLFEPVFVYRSGWAPIPRAIDYPQRQSFIDARYTDQARAAQVALSQARSRMDAPAISAAVAIDGDIMWTTAIGFADLEARAPVSLGSRFRIGSTSKAVTAIGVGVLVDRDLLDLDASIQTYAPNYPSQRWPISLRHVMSHRAGIRDYGVCFCFPVWEHLNTRRFETIDESIGLIARAPLQFEPGTDFAYTSLGYNLVGAAIEGASGKPFARFMTENVFTPLGMGDTGLDSAPGSDAQTVRFYDVENGRYKQAFAVDNSIRWPSGGLLSTPSDMVRLGSALLDDRLVSEETRRALVSVPEGGETTRGAKMYALGWRTGDWTLFNGSLKTRAHHHGGTAVGATSVLVVLPEFRMAVSTMMNKGATNTTDLMAATDAIIEAFLDKP
jgi:CubicO group peptidase (beta-lactamase class C family)